jgi:hypothetical protein
VKGLRKKGMDWCRHSQLIEDARVVLNSLQVWQVSHVRRKANRVAQRLTKEAESAY